MRGFVIGNLYYFNGDVYSDIDEICVVASERRHYIGSKLLSCFEKLSKSMALIVCLEHYNNKELNKFYKSNGYFIVKNVL